MLNVFCRNHEFCNKPILVSSCCKQNRNHCTKHGFHYFDIAECEYTRSLIWDPNNKCDAKSSKSGNGCEKAIDDYASTAWQTDNGMNQWIQASIISNVCVCVSVCVLAQ